MGSRQDRWDEQLSIGEPWPLPLEFHFQVGMLSPYTESLPGIIVPPIISL